MSSSPWLFSRRLDLLAFLAPALASLVLLAVGLPLGLLASDTPPVAWLALVVLIDVAHVWGNLLLIYTDRDEWRRRPRLWLSIPLIGALVGTALSSESELWLWRAMAALAVWHFVRQQVGWVKLYRARNREQAHATLDQAAAYAATAAPIVWWHAHLPRPFWWLTDGDFFVPLPAWAGALGLSMEACVLGAYAVRSFRAYTNGRGNPGKDIVIVTSALLWGLGIVVFESDYAFTVTNVLIHGVPYMILLSVTAERRAHAGVHVPLPLRHGMLILVLALWACAWIEETFWDRLIWHEHPDFFPLPAIDLNAARPWVLALLILPQLTHYVLDGIIWRRSENPYLL